MPPGEAIPTTAELIAEFDASQATIAHALARLRSQGIIERPHGRKRLVVAQHGAFSLFKISLIKTLWPSPDHDALLQAVYEAGSQEHWSFSVHTFTDIVSFNWTRAIGDSDAAILMGPGNIPSHLYQSFNNSRKPIVFMRDKPDGVKANFVWVSDVAVGRLATEHLLRLGHRRIAIMLSEPINASSSQRMSGWREALKNAGVADFDQLIFDCTVRPGAEATSGSYRLLTSILQHSPPPFTAMFCVSWTGALAAMRALRENGRNIPDDVSLITYGSEAAFGAFLNPPLTSVRTDVRQHAAEAIRLLRNALTKADSPLETVLLQPDIEERETTAPCRSTTPG